MPVSLNDSLAITCNKGCSALCTCIPHLRYVVTIWNATALPCLFGSQSQASMRFAIIFFPVDISHYRSLCICSPINRETLSELKRELKPGTTIDFPEIETHGLLCTRITLLNHQGLLFTPCAMLSCWSIIKLV